MRPLKPEPLRLRAEAAADYDVISACLQDALMPLSEMAYLDEEARFVAVFDRFTWEACAPGNNPRPKFVVQAVLRFEGVSAVRLHAVDLVPARFLVTGPNIWMLRWLARSWTASMALVFTECPRPKASRGKLRMTSGLLVTRHSIWSLYSMIIFSRTLGSII